jgi:hypothetical protein
MSRRSRFFAPVLLALSVGFAVAGCETLEKLNPFEEKQAPLPGVRKPLFPEGVPGVEFGAPPPQPSNSNIPIPANTTPAEAERRLATPEARAPEAAKAGPAAPPQPAKSSAKTKKSGDPDDAWSGTR